MESNFRGMGSSIKQTKNENSYQNANRINADIFELTRTVWNKQLMYFIHRSITGATKKGYHCNPLLLFVIQKKRKCNGTGKDHISQQPPLQVVV